MWIINDDWLSLQCLLPWINHLPTVCWITFCISVPNELFGKFDITENSSGERNQRLLCLNMWSMFIANCLFTCHSSSTSLWSILALQWCCHKAIGKQVRIEWLQGLEHLERFCSLITTLTLRRNPDSKVHGVNMGPTWVRSAPDGSHIGPMKLALRVDHPKSTWHHGCGWWFGAFFTDTNHQRRLWIRDWYWLAECYIKACNTYICMRG